MSACTEKTKEFIESVISAAKGSHSTDSLKLKVIGHTALLKLQEFEALAIKLDLQLTENSQAETCQPPFQP